MNSPPDSPVPECTGQRLPEAGGGIPAAADAAGTMLTDAEFYAAEILIVDDSEANVRLLEQTLRAAGYLRLTTTVNPREVSGLYRVNRYDLILLDLEMPGMDGFEVMEGLKEIETDNYIPVLVVTAQPEHMHRALQSGARDFISKPIDLVEVRARVRNLLETRLLHKKARAYAACLEVLALQDPLTKLPNRRLLKERASLAIADARRNNSIMALVFLDLDGFKQINDAWGHSAGDILLQMAAERLSAGVREQDTVARVGGDEFVIALWPNITPDAAAALGAKLIAALSQPYLIQERMLHVTASAGAGLYPAHGSDIETLMKSADLALYEAKRSGKKHYRVSERITL